MKLLKSLKATRFGGEVVTISCFEDNSRVKEMLARDGAGKVLVVDGGKISAWTDPTCSTSWSAASSWPDH